NPVKFLDGFDDTSREENGAFIIINKSISFVISIKLLSLEILIIINKINLKSFAWQRSYFYNQRLVKIINNNVHPGKTNHLMKLKFTFADLAKSWHKNAYIVTILVHLQ